MIYQTPECGTEELAAIERIQGLWAELRFYVAADQQRWIGPVRRILTAVANQGSNSIEGYNISTEDAVAAIQGATEPTDSRWEDWQANVGYQRSMTYVLQLARDSHFDHSAALLRSLHFMMVDYDFNAGPGLWRSGPIWVQNNLTKEVVYTGPDEAYVPGLIDELVAELNAGSGDVIVRAAMAHLNFVLIHPFSDGNGRMARCLQSLVLVRDGLPAREFCSIEEFLGVPGNQQRYYAELAAVANGKWTPENAARSWVRFCLEAHYIQAASVLRRVRESQWIWGRLDAAADAVGLLPRVSDALFDASLGLKIRNQSYRDSLRNSGEEISAQSATLDLRAMVDAGLLVQRGAKRGSSYVAAPALAAIRQEARQNREPLTSKGLFDPIIREQPNESVSSAQGQVLSLFATDVQP